jgi:hypothetical protein
MTAEEPYEKDFGGTMNGSDVTVGVTVRDSTHIRTSAKPEPGEVLVRIGNVRISGQLAQIERTARAAVWGVRRLQGHLAEAEADAQAPEVPTACDTCKGVHTLSEPHLKVSADVLRNEAYRTIGQHPFAGAAPLPRVLVDAAAYFVGDGRPAEARLLLHTFAPDDACWHVIQLLQQELRQAGRPVLNPPTSPRPTQPPPLPAGRAIGNRE